MLTSPDVLLDRYADAVIQAPLNLTSATDKAIFKERHIGDALALNQKIVAETAERTIQTVLDVGTGNGIPGVVLALMHPEWHVTLLDSSNKKCLFLDTFIKNNAIENAMVVCTRAEDFGRTDAREAFDIVVCRALEKLPTALELTLPLVKLTGLLIVSHGTSWPEEIRRSENGLNLLGAEFDKAIPYAVGDTTFHLLIFKKNQPTPARYPRNVGIPTKRPL